MAGVVEVHDDDGQDDAFVVVANQWYKVVGGVEGVVAVVVADDYNLA